MELVYEKDEKDHTFSILLIVVYLGLSNSQCLLTRSVWKKFDIQNVRVLAGWLWICSGLQYLQCQHPDVTSCRVYRDVSNRIHGIPAGIQEFRPPKPEVLSWTSGNPPQCRCLWNFDEEIMSVLSLKKRRHVELLRKVQCIPRWRQPTTRFEIKPWLYAVCYTC